jgi:hypothetical protein
MLIFETIMKMINKFLTKASVILALTASVLTVNAQSNFKLEVEQNVVSGNLYLDVFIQKTSGNDFPLGSSNFAVYLNNTALNLTGMTIENSFRGPYDISFDPTSYVNMSLGGHNYNFSNLSVLRNTSGSGTGQLVTETRVRVGRVKIPIVNQCEYNTISWVIGPAAITNFSGTSIKQFAEFVNPQPFPLCEVPVAPAITSNVLEFCEGTTLNLSSDAQGEVQWYKNGIAISGATSSTLAVSEAGEYTLEAVNCLCKSTQATSVNVTMSPLPTLPVITVNNSELLTSSTGDLQWYLDGTLINGATSAVFEPTVSGTYTVMATNNCGTVTSDPVVFNMPTSIKNFANAYSFGAYPNPYKGETTISYTLKKSESVKIDVYNALGQFMTSIVNENKDAGIHNVNFSAKQLGYSTGVYTVKMYIGKNIATIKLVEID